MVLGKSHQVVDWYHAKEHLIAAARLMKQDGTAAYTRWLKNRETLLYQGHADKIADELEKTGGPGMRWSRQGAENLLPVRAAVLSGRFDQMWDAAKNLPPS
ncbi:MAG: hypothetical protein KGS73_18285 [Chloroflexi bacterium]|nr:hypothetical protein [Chloroflexota bacterium]